MAVLRFGAIVRQQHDRTCAFAAAATVLRSLGLPVGEDALIQAAGVPPGTPGSVASITRAVAAWDVESFAVWSTWGKLREYFRRYPEPVVALIDAGRPHFTVVVGVDETAAYLADPSLGYRTLSRSDFERRWGGVVLFLRPRARTAGGAPFRDAALEGLRERHLRLLEAQAWTGAALLREGAAR